MSYNPSVGARQNLRLSSLAITTSYDTPAFSIRCANFNTLTLLCDLALNTATSVEIQVEVATPADTPGLGNKDPDPVAADWYARTSSNDSGLTVGSGIITIPTAAAVYQLGATGKYEIVIRDLMSKWVRVKAKTTGGPGSTTLAIVGVQGLT